jgi:hypothetical protein
MHNDLYKNNATCLDAETPNREQSISFISLKFPKLHLGRRLVDTDQLYSALIINFEGGGMYSLDCTHNRPCMGGGRMGGGGAIQRQINQL